MVERGGRGGEGSVEDLDGRSKRHVFSRETGNWRKKDDLEGTTWGIERGHIALLLGKI